jgi:hypothetical protein
VANENAVGIHSQRTGSWAEALPSVAATVASTVSWTKSMADHGREIKHGKLAAEPEDLRRGSRGDNARHVGNAVVALFKMRSYSVTKNPRKS